MISKFFSLTDKWVHPAHNSSNNFSELFRVRTVLVICAITCICVPIPWYFQLNEHGFISLMGLVKAISMLFYLSAFITLRTSRKVELSAGLYIYGALLSILFTAYIGKKLLDPTLMWLPLAPVVAYLLGGLRLSYKVFAVAASSLAVIATISYYDLQASSQLTNITGQAFRLALPILAGFGVVFGFHYSTKDIVRRLEKSQRDLASESQKLFHSQKLASLGELSAGLAHEINNPLSIIVMGTDALAKGTLEPEIAQKRITMINTAANRISKIIAGMKKYSRAEVTTQRNHLDVSELLEGALNLTSLKIEKHKIEIEVCSMDQLNLYCNEAEIEQVLVNLIINAIDSIKDSSNPWIRLEAFEEAPYTVIRVTDSGSPLGDETKAKIFDPFFTTKPVGQGTGLGLPISRTIIENHYGELSIPDDATNSCFQIKIPSELTMESAA